MYNTGCCQLPMIFTCGLVLTLIALFFWCLIYVFGENSKHFYMYVIVTGVYNPLTVSFMYNTGCWQLLKIITCGLVVTLIALLFWYLIHAFGEKSKYLYMY